MDAHSGRAALSIWDREFLGIPRRYAVLLLPLAPLLLWHVLIHRWDMQYLLGSLPELLAVAYVASLGFALTACGVTLRRTVMIILPTAVVAWQSWDTFEPEFIASVFTVLALALALVAGRWKWIPLYLIVGRYCSYGMITDVSSFLEVPGIYNGCPFAEGCITSSVAAFLIHTYVPLISLILLHNAVSRVPRTDGMPDSAEGHDGNSR